ncbi:sulfite exporter TauE/SafE family protein [Caulobacter sp. NIBR1757]|uniref:sulfite exporter TauE/SafE family protein n=1 Tax=Caulobacter sp. NIBR1757 TaxID=3016000 RepID=UPI0022F081DB|nr:sulfite exporter TauE/SafE family protein [Caulobacter sp. NIBR1757]WGM37738.1 putative membrane transporter protein YfcA [Caulobacter sp. NIBR1757]
MPSIESAGLLLAAGLLAGVMNAVAGGGTFVALPALAFMGLPPTVANASSTVALFPGTLASAWSYRKDIRPFGPVPTASLLWCSLLGGLVGAVLLLLTPERAFSAVIPWLLLLATATLAAGPRLSGWIRTRGLHAGPRFVLAAQLVLGIYGGYFGGAVGLMMLAAWSLTSTADLRALNPIRTLMVAAANGMAVVCFVVTANVRWPETLLVMIGGIAGGYLGAQLGRRLPLVLLRGVILTIAVVTTALYFAQAYLR